METTVQLFRTLANRSRIRILRVLVVLDERRVAQVVEAAGSVRCTASNHLHALAVSGLVWRRRSGRAVYYRLAEEPSNEVTRTVTLLLRRVFGRVRATDPRHVADCDQRESGEYSDDALFACFTAFTHPRRLQIIRHLAENGQVRPGRMAAALGMSPPACSRHVSKLSRRGMVRTVRSGGADVCELLAKGTSVGQTLLRAVLDQLTR